MALTTSFGHLDSGTRKRLLRLFNRCFIALRRGEVVTETTISDLLPRTTLAEDGGTEESVGVLFFEEVRALIAYFVASGETDRELEFIEKLTSRICTAARRSLGQNLEGWEVSFQNIAQLK